MNPRRKTKQKWTAFPKELITQIQQVFEQNFSTYLGTETSVHVLGKIFTQEICLRVGLHKKGELKHQNFEVSIDHDGDHENVISQIHLCVDAIASLMLDYFKNDEEIELPFTWEEMPFDEGKIYVQFSRENPSLEAEADRLLGENPQDSLINEMAEVDDNEPLDTEATAEKPTMFSGKKNKKEHLH